MDKIPTTTATYDVPLCKVKKTPAKLEYSEKIESLRKQVMIERLMQSTSKGKPLQTSKLPPSSILNEVKSFLPLLKSANEHLTESADRQDIGIEDIPDNCHSYVEMDVAFFSDSEDGSDSETTQEPDSNSFNSQSDKSNPSKCNLITEV